MSEATANLSLKLKLHSETAKISWIELQRFFAQGLVLLVSDDCDLIEVAVYFAEDQAQKLKPMLADGRIAAPTDRQARGWFEARSLLWSVVVAPFVLVQQRIGQ